MGTGKGDREFCECGGGIGEHDWLEHQTAVNDNLYRISQGWDPAPVPRAPCRHCDCKEYRARTAAVTSPAGSMTNAMDDGTCSRAGCRKQRETPTSAYCREHGAALSRGLALAADDQLARAAKMDAGQCTTPGCTGRPEPRETICAPCANSPNTRRRHEKCVCGAEPGEGCRHLPDGSYHVAYVRAAPSLKEVRDARRGVARDIEKRKEELAAHLASVFPDCNFVVRIAFDVRPDTTPERRAAAEAKIKAAGIVSEPCQCLRWEEWAQTIVGARGHAEAYKSLRDRVTAVLGTASKTTSDAHQVGRDALAVTRAAQQDAENARKAERSADGKLRQAQSLLRRCYCGRPDPDPEYPRDRDKYLGRS